MANLLIVDDDDDLRELLAELLSTSGHRVRSARDGEEGLVLVDEDEPDGILLDVDMPKLDGPGMATQMLIDDAGHEQIPILLLSGCADLACVARAIGTPYYLVKPAAPATLMATLARMLRERIPPRPGAVGQS
jgi:DNA-binding response OmpR family regulator